MSAHEAIARLAEVLEREAAQLGELAAAMQRERAAFVAVGPAALEEGIQAMASLAVRAAELAREREQACAAVGARLGTATPTLGALLPHVPADLRARLEGAAAAVRSAAQRVRIEGRIGGRLLQESRRWLRALRGGVGDDRGSATVYDGRARARAPQASAGALLKGTL